MSIETCQSSGLLAASAVVSNRPAKLCAVTIIDAAAACTVILYDSATTNSGTILAQINATVNASTNSQVFHIPVEALNGIYAAVTGTGVGCIVHFEKI